MFQQIFDSLKDIVGGMGTTFSELFAGVTKLFYTAPVEGVGGGLTFIGVMSLVGLGIGLFMFGFRFIKNLIKMRG